MGALAFNVFIVVVFALAVFETFGWRQEVALFPQMAASLGLLMAASQLAMELWKRWRGPRPAAAGGAGESAAEDDAEAPVRIGRRGAAWLFVGLACVVLLGVPVGVPLFVVFLVRFGFDDSWPLAIGLSVATVIIILAVFGGIFGAIWAEPLLIKLFGV